VTAVVAYVPDLMDRSRVSAAVPGASFAASPEALVDAAAAAGDPLVLVDLARPGVLAVVPRLAGRVVGFASHVDRATIAAAEAAGCDDVLPRSAFFRRLPDLVGGAPPG
jgi:hypothetical protein